MPDDPLDTIAAAALDIAGQGGWAAVTLPAVAGAAGLTLEALHAAVPGGRNALVGAVVQRVDRAMLARCGAPDMGLTPRERLFEVMMARAEAMEESRAGLMALIDGCAREPGAALAAACALKRSAGWMLAAAGIEARGPFVRAGALGVWLRAVAAWRGDTGPDLPRTMAALDQALARAEQAAWIVCG
jgi:ubiquinone biosynthesis protein COQ9